MNNAQNRALKSRLASGVLSHVESHLGPCGPVLQPADFWSSQPSLCHTRTLHQMVLGAQVVIFEVVETVGSQGTMAVLSVLPCKAPLTGSAEHVPTCSHLTPSFLRSWMCCNMEGAIWGPRASGSQHRPVKPAHLCHLASVATGPAPCMGQCEPQVL